MASKIYPTAGRAVGNMADDPELRYTLRPDDLRRALQSSLKALGATKIDLWYLHGPDRDTPLEDTLREVDALYKKGFFSRFGISNFPSWEVASMCELCDRHG